MVKTISASHLAFAVVISVAAPALADARQDCRTLSDDARIRACDRAIRQNPKDAHSYNYRGAAFWSKYDAERAVANYTKAIELDPKYASAYYNRSVVYSLTGDIHRAIADLTKVTVLNPERGSAYFKRGLLHKDIDRTDLAIADFTKAIELDPKDRFSYLHRGLTYSKQGDVERAIIDITKAQEFDSSGSGYATALGMLKYNKGDFSGAATDTLRVIESSNINAKAVLFRYLARSRAGEAAEVELQANSARLEDREWPFAAIELYLGQRSPEATLAAAIKPDDRCESQFFLGQWHLLKGRRDAAKSYFVSAVAQCEKDHPGYEISISELKKIN